MSGYSDEHKKLILEATRHGAAYQGPEEGYLALTTVAVVGADKGTTITEPTYTGYKRILHKKADWAAAAENQLVNAVNKIFPECTAGESDCIGWAWCTTEATKSGLIICSGKIPTAHVSAGITPEFLAGALIFKIIDT